MLSITEKSYSFIFGHPRAIEITLYRETKCIIP
jgi:hypothetical protein